MKEEKRWFPFESVPFNGKKENQQQTAVGMI